MKLLSKKEVKTKKATLLTSLVKILFVSLIMVNMLPSFGNSATVLAVSPTVVNGITTNLIPGSTFYIEITIHDVIGMLGYGFQLDYDTDVLTATSFKSYPPFTMEWPSRIVDTAGYVEMTYTWPIPELFGLDVYPEDPPFPVARIDFIVEAFGFSPFDLVVSKIPDVYGGIIEHEVVNGCFSNIESYEGFIFEKPNEQIGHGRFPACGRQVRGH